jgi:hypothetical protein
MRALTMEEVEYVSGGLEVVIVTAPRVGNPIGLQPDPTGGFSPINWWGAGAGLLGDVASEVASDWLSGVLRRDRPSQTKATEIRSGVQNKATTYVGRMKSPDQWGNMNNTTYVYKDKFGNAFFLIDDGTDNSFEAVVMSTSSGQRFQWSGSGWDPLDS